MPLNDNDDGENVVQVEKQIDTRENTAFYIYNSRRMFPDVPFEEMYKDIHKAIVPYLKANTPVRHVIMAQMVMMLDSFSCMIGATDYESDDAKSAELTREKDVELFVGSFINMMNQLDTAITTNRNLMQMQKSIFNKSKDETH